MSYFCTGAFIDLHAFFVQISSDQCEEDTSWSVLREDFVKGSKYKDWDKTDESLGSICIDSDSASDDSGL